MSALNPTKTKSEVFCILEFKHVRRHGSVPPESIRFIAGARSLNEQDLRDNPKFFKVPEARIISIRTKLTVKIYDVYANILRGMFSSRFNGSAARLGTSRGAQSRKNGVLIHLGSTGRGIRSQVIIKLIN